MGDIELLSQLIGSMADAVIKLEIAKEQNKISDFNSLKKFILDIHGKIGREMEK